MGVAQPGDVQCDATHVSGLLLVLALHAARLVVFRGTLGQRLCTAALVLAIVRCVAVLEIVILTFMHQLMGMMAAEIAVRFLAAPLVAAASWGDALVWFVLWLPNFMILLGETVMAIRVDAQAFALGIGPVFFGLDHFGTVAFYKKQHATLHTVLCIALMSSATSLVPRWRRSPTAQQARIVVEPACMVSVAMILLTHRHGAGEPALASHPAIGSLVIMAALVQVLVCLAHLSAGAGAAATSPSGRGRADGDAAPPPDLTRPLPPGVDSPALKMLRGLLAYTCLLLAYFLYVDTYMEYLGCRLVILEVGPPDTGPRVGLTGGSELFTYLSLAVIGAALALACLLVAGAGARAAPPEGRGSADEAADGESIEQQKQALLPMVSKDGTAETEETEMDAIADLNALIILGRPAM